MKRPDLFTIHIPNLSFTIRDKPEWTTLRKQAEQSNNECCYVCGVHKSEAKYRTYLYGQEIFSIEQDIATLTEVVCLCYSCYYFIDVSRLLGDDFGYERTKEIFRHGFNILKEHNLKPTIKTAVAYLHFTGKSRDEIDSILEERGIIIPEQIPIRKIVYNGNMLILE